MLKGFKEFILEAKGYSTAVGEYAALCVKVANAVIDKNLAQIKKGKGKEFVEFKKTEVINNAYSQVSKEASSAFPLDEIKIDFEITPVDQEDFAPYSGAYSRNYNKYRMQRSKGKKNLNIVILCKLYVPRKDLGIDRKILTSYFSTVFNHEIMHAFNDFKDPNFFRGYRLAIMRTYLEKVYPDFMQYPAFKSFFDLLYGLSDAEIKAQVGETPEFRTKDEFYASSAYNTAMQGIEYDPEEYREAILSEFKDTKYSKSIDRDFGKFFVHIYREVASKRKMPIDSAILKLEKGADLGEVLEFFESHIKGQAKILKDKLIGKITQQGEGRLI